MRLQKKQHILIFTKTTNEYYLREMSDVSAAAASRKVRAASEVPDREDDSDEVTIF